MNAMSRGDVFYALIFSIKFYKNIFQNIFHQISYFENVFNVKSTFILLLHDEHNHVIDLTLNKNLFYEFLYNMSQKKIETLKKYIRDNLTLNRIRYSIVDTNVSIFLILKKNKNLRLCVNYKNFNVVINKNKISLFFIDETLNYFVDVAYFIKFNFKNIYYKIRIREKKRLKTTFRTRYELFEYIIIFFELINVFVTF